MSIQKEELQGNWTPMKSALYAAQEVEKIEFDFWGRFFIRISILLGVLLYVAIGAIILFLFMELVSKLT